MSVVVKNSGGVDLAKSTQATATADKIANGLTAWVNGVKITGTADIGKTVVLEHSGDYSYTFNLDSKPKAMLAEFGSNGVVKQFGTFLKVMDTEYKKSSGAPEQSVSFGNTSVTMKFLSNMSSSYTPYFKVTAIY